MNKLKDVSKKKTMSQKQNTVLLHDSKFDKTIINNTKSGEI